MGEAEGDAGLGAGAASDAQAGENDSQGDVGMGGGDTAGYGAMGPVDAANEALGDLGLGSAGYSDSIASLTDEQFASHIAQSSTFSFSTTYANTIGIAFGYSAMGAIGGFAMKGLEAATAKAVGYVTSKLALQVALSLGLVTSPLTAVAVAAVASYLGNRASQMTQDAIDSPSSSVAADSFSDLSSDGREEAVKILGELSDRWSDETVLLEDLSGVLSDTSEDTELSLYRRRSNIIGTGLQGLTIE